MLTNADPALAALFRPSIQPYMINWIAYDPAEEIKKLTIPVLIIQGENDLQVDPENAQILSKANPKAKVVMIAGMNHVMKAAEKDREKNFAAYADPELRVMIEVIDAMANFIRK